MTLLDASGSIEKSIRKWNGHLNAIFECAWSCDDNQLLSASGDGLVRLWDVETQRPLLDFVRHRCSVKTVSWDPLQPDIFVSAGRDGHIMMWDRRFKQGAGSTMSGKLSKPVVTILNAHVPEGLKMLPDVRKTPVTPLPPKVSSSVTGVSFTGQSQTIASIGATDGLVKLWDLRCHASRSTRKHLQVSRPRSDTKRLYGYSSISRSLDGSRLFASCLDDSIHVFDSRLLGDSLAVLKHPLFTCSSFYVKTSVSPDGSHLMSGSSSGRTFLWDLHTNRPPLVLKGHEMECCGVSWSKHDPGLIATCSDDMTVRVWNAGIHPNSLSFDPSVAHLRKTIEAVESINEQRTESNVSLDVSLETVNDANQENLSPSRSSNRILELSRTMSRTSSPLASSSTIRLDYTRNTSPATPRAASSSSSSLSNTTPFNRRKRKTPDSRKSSTKKRTILSRRASSVSARCASIRDYFHVAENSDASSTANDSENATGTNGL